MSHLLRKSFLIVLVATFGLILFYHFGGAVWRPIKARLSGQKTVGQVLRELEPSVADRFQNLESLTDGSPITLLAFKEERRLEIWKQRNGDWRFIRSYPFTAYSGQLGPKLREGDGQIPEGIYRIEYLNPNSSFHLSLKVDYPNSFDRKMAASDGREQLGDDIFIHGKKATVGCIPIGDHNIEEVFYLIAKNGYQNTSVIIAPFDLRLGRVAPEIEELNWESELYHNLYESLRNYPLAGAP